MPTRTRRRPVKPASKPRPRPRAGAPRSARRRPGPLTALLLLVAAATVVVAILSLRSSPTALVSERTVTVSRGVIQTVVSGSGNLAPAKQVDVDFATSGKLTKIYTKAGAHVSKGELLARIDNRSQRVDVAKAEAALVDAEDALTKAQDAEASGTTTSTAASTEDATATTASAATTEDATATTASAATAGAATSGAARATTVAFVAQATPTASAAPTETPRGEATPTPSATATPRASATPAPTSAAPSGGSRTSSGGASGGSGTDSSSSSAGGGSTQSVESAQAAVDSAQLALEDAQDALDDTVLRAPMAGTVASVSGEVGDTTGSGSSSGGAGGGDTSSSSSSAFIVLAQLSRLKIQVGLSESDIGKVEVGQSATVTINAASGEDVAGHVTDVGVLASDASSGSGASSSSGAVSYPVTITLDQSTDGIKAGMSATADIVVARVSGISVPSQALRGSSVTVERGGKRSTVRVQTGVVGDSATQVISGLNAGDKVIVTSTSAASGRTASGTGTQQQTGRFGAGGLGGGGLGGGGFRAGGGGGLAVPPGGPGG
jgi:multidrug efflux pump subunit AcrA (membrane-fusion protein)